MNKSDAYDSGFLKSGSELKRPEKFQNKVIMRRCNQIDSGYCPYYHGSIRHRIKLLYRLSKV
jgi:hypothetical protein